MNKKLANSLARAVRPTEFRDSDTRLVREALDRFEPSNLSELYIAIRAAASKDEQDLVDCFCELAENDPERSLIAFLESRETL